ncbi:MAG: YdiU family protein, partial [Gammaproteobacteria bacterium]|nr:YdiU family protein [Gammaproteobacteria bacterium]
AMFHLGISTSQALCMTTSDEEVYRERIESGAMLLRVAPSHIRFGHFEYAFYSHKHDYLKELANYVLEHHYADVKHNQQGYLFLLKQAIKKTAKMIAQWQSVGFMHGVMNTDNMSILGLTIDYGPFGFMDSFESGFICNHSDHAGRYSYKNQPEIGLFNLSCLAQTFLPLLNDDVDEAVTIAKSELTQYQKLYEQYYLEIMQQKLGLESVAISFIEQLFSLMEVHKVDFTIFFRLLSELNTNQNRQTVIDLFSGSSDFNDWFEQYQQLVAYQSEELETRSIRMKLVNPKYVLRNYLAEQAIRLAEDENDFSEVERLMELLAKPFDEQEESEHYAVTPPRWSEELSISCSS